MRRTSDQTWRVHRAAMPSAHKTQARPAAGLDAGSHRVIAAGWSRQGVSVQLAALEKHSRAGTIIGSTRPAERDHVDVVAVSELLIWRQCQVDGPCTEVGHRGMGIERRHQVVDALVDVVVAG